jgi:transcriptional regulator with XRE-family HTH domain
MKGLRVPRFHEQMRLLLAQRGLMQKNAAALLGVNPNQISRWCDDQMPGSFDALKAIADTFGVPWEWLLVGDEGRDVLNAYRDSKWKPPPRGSGGARSTRSRERSAEAQ